MGEQVFPDDWVEGCAVCNHPTIVVNHAIIFSRKGTRWVFHNLACFNEWLESEGYIQRELQ